MEDIGIYSNMVNNKDLRNGMEEYNYNANIRNSKFIKDTKKRKIYAYYNNRDR